MKSSDKGAVAASGLWLRAILAGFPVIYAAKSYILHFLGKSNRRSGEAAAETAARDQTYFARFREVGQQRLPKYFSAW